MSDYVSHLSKSSIGIGAGTGGGGQDLFEVYEFVQHKYEACTPNCVCDERMKISNEPFAVTNRRGSASKSIAPQKWTCDRCHDSFGFSTYRFCHQRECDYELCLRCGKNVYDAQTDSAVPVSKRFGLKAIGRSMTKHGSTIEKLASSAASAARASTIGAGTSPSVNAALAARASMDKAGMMSPSAPSATSARDSTGWVAEVKIICSF